MDLRLTDYNVLVTGSSKGIGKAIAKEFVLEGANVVLTGREQAALRETERELGQLRGGEVWSAPGDLCDSEHLTELKEGLKNRWSSIDTLVCNLGSGKAPTNFGEEMQDWARIFEINLFCTIRIIKVLWDLLESDESAAKKRSKSIICISSICGYERLGCPVPYAAAKAALNSFVKNITTPCAAAGIRANIVSPGNIMFSGSTWEGKMKRNPEEVQDMVKREIPLGVFGAPEDIAHTVVFLASEKAGFVTGANWVVDGGQTGSY